MKENRIIGWGVVLLIFLTTLLLTIGNFSSFGQTNTLQEQDRKGSEDLTKYPVVDFDSPEPANILEREERRLKNARYDKKGFVLKKVHPDTDGVSVDYETPPSLPIPTIESNLIIVGRILDAKASLSNDKSGIYSEYTIQIGSILKANGSSATLLGGKIKIDRPGGIVHYPDGKKVIYFVSGKNLPRVGSEYLFFLVSDQQSPNYEILTGYELRNGKVNPLDITGQFTEFKDSTPMDFINAVRSKIRSTPL